MRRRALLTVVGLGLAALGFVGCERTIISGEPPVVIPPPPPAPANQINVRLAFVPTIGSVADINGTKVSVYPGGGGSVIKDTTVSGVTTSPYTLTIDLGLSGGRGTYQVLVQRSGYTLQTAVTTITDEVVPIVGFTVKKIASSNTIVLNPPVTIDPVATVAAPPIRVEQPPDVQQVAENVPPTEVIIPAASGVSEVNVSTQTAADVPLVISNNVISAAVVGAVQIQATVADASKADAAQVTVSIPVPIDSSKIAQAQGGLVDVIKFDTKTQRWTNVLNPLRPDGKFLIDSTGRVKADVTGIQSNTIIAISLPPRIETQTATIPEPSPTVSAAQVDQLKQRGDTVFTAKQEPTISATSSGKIGRTSLIPAPPPLTEAQWANAAAYIAQEVPVLRRWLYSDDPTVLLPLPAVTSEILRKLESRNFTFNFDFGAVTISYSLRLTWKGWEVVPVYHLSGEGGGG